MRVAVFVGVSIDGYIAHEDGSLGFLAPFEGEAIDNGYEAHMREVDTLIVGRGTYDTVLDFPAWPWDGKRVIVLTHRPIAARHGETTYAGALSPLLATLSAKCVYLDGGGAIRQGLDENVVTDMTISIVPRTIGRGRLLFRPGVSRTDAWDVTSVRQLANGIVQIRYSLRR